jgi:hypothetical protein
MKKNISADRAENRQLPSAVKPCESRNLEGLGMEMWAFFIG